MTSIDDRVARVYAMALEMEERGRSFYEHAQQTCRNRAGKEMFRVHMGKEVVHIGRIRTIYASIEKGKGLPDAFDSASIATDSEALTSIFEALARRHEAADQADPSDIEAVATGIALEQKAILFYEERRSQATEQKELTFIDLMIREEKTHHRMLTEMRFYLTDPAGWFREKERGGLDGA